MTTAPHIDTQGHASGRGYLIGSLLSVALTTIPFWLVMSGALHNPGAAIAAIFLLAAIQIVVHVVCFLHLDARSEGGWSLVAFVFTAIIVGITICGSVWVMYHLDANMMPIGSGGAMPNMP